MGKRTFFLLLYLFLGQNLMFAIDNAIILQDSLPSKIPIHEYIYYFEDTEGKYTLSDLQRPINSHLFKPNKKNTITPGFTSSVYWLKFSIENSSNQNQNLVLSLSYPLIKEIDLYIYRNNKIIQVIKTGDNRLFSTRDIKHRDFLFSLELESGKKYTYYLYANNYGETLRFPLDLYNYSGFIVQNYRKNIVAGAFYGLLVFVLIFILFLYYSMRERLYLYYTFYVFFLGVFLCNLDGFSFQFFWPNSPWFGNHSTIFSSSLANFFLLVFSQSFLQTQKYSPLFNRLIRYFAFAALLIFIMAFFSGRIYLFSVLAVNVFSIVSILTVMIAALYSISPKNIPAYYFLFSFFIFMLSVIIYVMRNLGVLSDNIFTSYILKFGFASELLLLTFAIADRFRRIKDVANQELEELVQLKSEEIVSQNEEITQQSSYLQKVNEELEMLSTVLNEADNGVTIFNTGGLVEWQNKGFRKLYGYSYEDKLLLKTSNAFELSDNEYFIYFFQKAKKTKKTVVYKTNTINRGGDQLWIQTTLTPITDSNNNIIKYIAFDTDITYVKSTEEELKKKNLDVTSSIVTAQRIQKAILPPKHLFRKLFKESFVILKPKDIVSGDFYWLGRKDHNIFFAAVDCTGHGVPGAFMSIVGNNLLNQAIKNMKLTKPSEILNYLNISVNRMLRQDSNVSSGSEGMDLALCALNFETNTLQYSGARNPLYLFRDGKLIEIKGDNYSVGIFYEQKYRKFTNHEIQVKSGDRVYVFSDGFADQFGGKYRKKYLKKNFKKLLISIQEMPMKDQKNRIIEEFDNWKRSYDQLDDVLIMGIGF